MKHAPEGEAEAEEESEDEGLIGPSMDDGREAVPDEM
jgi:hypothetical protein